jgi:integrase/recombinase XerD
MLYETESLPVPLESLKPVFPVGASLAPAEPQEFGFPRYARGVAVTQKATKGPIVLKHELARAIGTFAGLGPLPTLQPGSKAARRREKASAKQANTLSKKSIERVEQHIAVHSRSPASDLLKFRLSLRAGLRAGEIAALRVEDMLAANGAISDKIEVRTLKQRYTKRSRKVEMHPEIREALAELLTQHPCATRVAFSLGRDGQPRYQSAGCVANWFHRLYRNAGLLNCSSHSGRRTFATEVARHLPAHQGSLRDLQIVMGHARIASTECYLEQSDKMGEIIRSLGA